jgi:exopolysaccharide biosynthesis WecB/TagA/CpsF family protein
MPFQHKPFLGLPLTSDMSVQDVCNLLDNRQGCFITFINPAAWSMAQKRSDYLAALQRMTFVLPDGQGVAFAARKLANRTCLRISFDMSSLADLFFKKLESTAKSVMLIGGAPGVADQVKAKLAREYPKLYVLHACDGFGDRDSKVVTAMRLNPDAIIVGMGVPYQEELLLALMDGGYDGLALTCGGFFDQYLQASEYYPPFVNRFHLRFVFRFYKEPKRLWRRYLIDYQSFVFACLRAAIERSLSRVNLKG